jgi:formate dehydrogenase major subunit
MAGRGHLEKIVFDINDPMGASTCVACGECVQACPTGALMPSTMVDENNVYRGKPDRTVDSVCPYCGVGCQLTYQIKNDKIVAVAGKNGPANQNRLCVKGRFGFDYVANPQRLLKPMIRKDGVPKVPHETIDPSNPWTHFREATWEEALDRAAAGLKKIRDRDGPDALAGFGSAKGSNEEAYLFQKLVRTGFGTNNVDHCTRLCHASSVSALLEGVGSAAVTATFNECKNSEVIIVIGANPTDNHPVAATFFKQAAKRGAKLVVMDPRGTAMKRHAWKMLQFKNGTDVAMLNAMLNVIVTEKLYDQQYIQTYVEGFEAWKENVRDFTPEEMAPICGIDADTLRPRRKRDHLLGHGRLPAHPWHRQRPLPDRAVADHRPGRPARHGAASAARPEQRAGRFRRRPHSDVLPRLQVGGESGSPRPVRGQMGREAAAQARQDRG